MHRLTRCLYTWGNNSYNKCGHLLPVPKPTKLNLNVDKTKINLGFENIKDIKFGVNHTIALSQSGSIFTWGDNYYGQCGIMLESNSFSDFEDEGECVLPTKLDLTGNQIATTHFGSFILKDGNLTVFGAGILGTGNEHADSNPQSVEYFDNIAYKVKDIQASGDVIACLASSESKPNSKELFMWGYIGSRKAILPTKVDVPFNIEAMYLTHGHIGVLESNKLHIFDFEVTNGKVLTHPYYNDNLLECKHPLELKKCTVVLDLNKDYGQPIKILVTKSKDIYILLEKNLCCIFKKHGDHYELNHKEKLLDISVNTLSGLVWALSINGRKLYTLSGHSAESIHLPSLGNYNKLEINHDRFALFP